MKCTYLYNVGTIIKRYAVLDIQNHMMWGITPSRDANKATTPITATITPTVTRNVLV